MELVEIGMESPSSIFLGVGSFAKQGAMSAFSVNRLMDLIFVQAKVSYFTSYQGHEFFQPMNDDIVSGCGSFAQRYLALPTLSTARPKLT